MNTPWGMSDGHVKLAEGITFYLTPRHGGIELSPERIAQLPKGLKNFLGSQRWWEEDCDWAVPYYLFRKDILAAGLDDGDIEKRIEAAKDMLLRDKDYAHLVEI